MQMAFFLLGLLLKLLVTQANPGRRQLSKLANEYDLSASPLIHCEHPI